MEAGNSRLRTWHQPAGCSRHKRSKRGLLGKQEASWHMSGL